MMHKALYDEIEKETSTKIAEYFQTIVDLLYTLKEEVELNTEIIEANEIDIENLQRVQLSIITNHADIFKKQEKYSAELKKGLMKMKKGMKNFITKWIQNN